MSKNMMNNSFNNNLVVVHTKSSTKDHQVAFVVTDKMLDALDDMANDQDRSRSYIARKACQEAINEYYNKGSKYRELTK